MESSVPPPVRLISCLPETLSTAADALVAKLILASSPRNNVEREQVIAWLQTVCEKAIDGRNFSVKLSASNACLPDEPYELTSVVFKNYTPQWHVRLQEALCNESASDTGGAVKVSNISVCPDERKLCVDVNGMSFVLTANDLRSVYETSVIEEVNALVGNSHLFKRSLLLIKAWFLYDSPRTPRSPWKGETPWHCQIFSAV
jgi:hypothetical protein